MSNKWNDTEKCKPKINENDEFDKMQRRSVVVLVWLYGETRPNFATYNHLINHWSVEGYMGFDQSRVKKWQYINNPYQ